MLIFTSKITKQFALDLCMFHKFRNFTDGISFFEFHINLDLFKADHNPKFEIFLAILNYSLIDFEIYNINHICQSQTNS